MDGSDSVGSRIATQLVHGLRPPSKHATKPGKGRLRIAENSSLRKLMRAANRGRIPAERLRTILQAMHHVSQRPEAWVHRHYPRYVPAGWVA